MGGGQNKTPLVGHNVQLLGVSSEGGFLFIQRTITSEYAHAERHLATYQRPCLHEILFQQ